MALFAGLGYAGARTTAAIPIILRRTVTVTIMMILFFEPTPGPGRT